MSRHPAQHRDRRRGRQHLPGHRRHGLEERLRPRLHQRLRVARAFLHRVQRHDERVRHRHHQVHQQHRQLNLRSYYLLSRLVVFCSELLSRAFPPPPPRLRARNARTVHSFIPYWLGYPFMDTVDGLDTGHVMFSLMYCLESIPFGCRGPIHYVWAASRPTFP